jgi:hypothetical protein
VALQVVDGDQRQAAGQRHRLAEAQAHHDAADQAGAGGRGHPVEIIPADARVGHRPGDDAVDGVDVGARRDLRHHAAVGAWCSVCRPTTEDSTAARPSTPRRTTAAAVSSQLVSTPSRVSGGLRALIVGRYSTPMLAVRIGTRVGGDRPGPA